MSRRAPSPFDLFADSMRLAVESQGVIALRMLKFAGGGAGAQDEFHRMFAEKALAVVEAQVEAGLSAITGQPQLAPARAVALYRRRVRANQRRLLRGG
jgi:hypothetical protein